MSKKTFALIFTLFTVAFVLVMVAVYSPSPTYDISSPVLTPKVTKVPLGETELRFGTLQSFSIPISSPSAKIVYLLPINIKTGKNEVTAVQLEMSYDSSVLTKIVVTPGSFFEKPSVFLNQVDEENGRISYAIGVGEDTSGIRGTGLVATLSFQAKTTLSKQTSMSFLPKTFVRGEGTSQSALKSTNSATIMLDK